jgi:hypothetical protein
MLTLASNAVRGSAVSSLRSPIATANSRSAVDFFAQRAVRAGIRALTQRQRSQIVVLDIKDRRMDRTLAGLIALTLGLPIAAFSILCLVNDIHLLMGFFVWIIAAVFGVGVIFEIKRLADHEPSSPKQRHH